MYTSPKVSLQYTDIMDLLFSEVTQHLKETLHYYFLVHMKRTYLGEKHLIMKFCKMFFDENKTNLISKYLQH